MVNKQYTEDQLSIMIRFYENAHDLKTESKTFSLTEHDVQSNIFDNLSINDLISLYNTNKFYQNELNKQDILNNLTIKFGIEKVTSFNEFIKEYKKYALRLLKQLAPMYNAGLGFNNSELCYYYDGSASKNTLKMLIKNNIPVYADGDKLITSISQFKKRNAYYVDAYENVNKFNKLAATILPYKQIKIVASGPWDELPKEWYNVEFGVSKDIDKQLPKINTKKYINIIKPFETVIVDSKIKGSDLTIDDVLFATRALAGDPWRSVGMEKGYKILEDTNDVLVLEETIDNWSS